MVQKSINDIILNNISLKEYNVYHTGGDAKYFSSPANNFELTQVINWAKGNLVDYYIIGCGANILISDEGYNGLAIILNKFNRYIRRNGNIIEVGAGIRLIDFIGFCVSRGLKGAEKLTGIPSSVGGAVFMNAGAYGFEMKDIVKSVTTLTGMRLSNEEVQFRYRESKGVLGEIITSVEFITTPSAIDVLKKVQLEVTSKRRSSQPLNYKSCGSVFKKVNSGLSAGELIENVGLKGYRIGGARISEKHANFIINFNNAKSSDIKSLIELAKSEVYKKTNIMLQEEVKFIGF